MHVSIFEDIENLLKDQGLSSLNWFWTAAIRYCDVWVVTIALVLSENSELTFTFRVTLFVSSFFASESSQSELPLDLKNQVAKELLLDPESPICSLNPDISRCYDFVST